MIAKPGTIIMIEDITRSDRPRLAPMEPEKPDGGMVVVTIMIALIFGLVVGMTLAALVLT